MIFIGIDYLLELYWHGKLVCKLTKNLVTCALNRKLMNAVTVVKLDSAEISLSR